ncbi:BatD family protein [Imhoffiella purpurea]|uniref:BatD n=1 Tax=Imhoffiella purpurea TaxID=1249627 RepID=W9VYA5_9GAMM|nr:BatD family protein [Imhoffiella purpurea]EXJ15355.1 BatD [Imhoffiella purpurea]
MPRTPLLRAALVVLLVSIGCAVQAAGLKAQVDRTRVSVGDVVTLRLVAEGDTRGDPDFGPLNADFDILRRGQSKTTSIVNGSISSTREWTLELAPKQVGLLRIPPIALGADQSQPITVEVVSGSTGSAVAGGDRPLFLKAEASERTPYVQQGFGYRVKVYYRQPPQRAVLSDPTADGAGIQRVGDDRSYDEYVDGVLYRVIERRYLVTPLKSGTLTINSPRLEAMVPDTSGGGRRDPFADLDDAFGGTLFQGFPDIAGFGQPMRRVVERAENLEIQVRPQPDEAGSTWLPATSVQIADEWTPTPPVFKVGEPVTRTLTLTVEGATSAQLPNLDMGALDGAQVYPDRPKAEDLAGTSAPTAVKSFKVAIVPSRAGELTLPEIRLPWWDTKADLPRVVVVPARTFEVAGGEASSLQPPAASPQPPASSQQPQGTGSVQGQDAATEAPSVPAGSPAAPMESSDRPDGASSSGGSGIWPWLAGGFGLAWIATLIWWLRERRAGRAGTRSVGESARRSPGFGGMRGVDLSAARRQVEKSCLDGDPRAARQALIHWGQVMWGEEAPKGMNALAARIGDEAALEILTEIDRAIYAPPGSSWDGASVWQRLGPLLAGVDGVRGDPDEDPLPELYPRD